MRRMFAILFIALTLTVPAGRGRAAFVETHTKFVNVGAGYDLHGRWGDVQVPPLHSSFDYGVRVAPKAPLTLGCVFAYARSREEGWDARYNYFAAGFRAAYHFTDFITVDRLDVYAGIVLGGVGVSGYENRWFKLRHYLLGKTMHRTDGYFLGGVYGGVRYFITKNVGLFAEVGYGIGYITGGASFTF